MNLHIGTATGMGGGAPQPIGPQTGRGGGSGYCSFTWIDVFIFDGGGPHTGIIIGAAFTFAGAGGAQAGPTQAAAAGGAPAGTTIGWGAGIDPV